MTLHHFGVICYDVVYSQGSISWKKSDFLNQSFRPFKHVFLTSRHDFHQYHPNF